MADDHARLRARVREALEASGCEVCGEGATADEAVALAVEHRPDVALLDIHMPGNGIRAAREIARSLPGTAVVMLTSRREDDDLFDSLRAGASGYLLKDTDPAALGDALRGVLDGRGRDVRAAGRPDHGRVPRAEPTPRFARAVARRRQAERPRVGGHGAARRGDDRRGGRRLFLSPTTVRVHVARSLRKLRVKDRERRSGCCAGVQRIERPASRTPLADTPP